MADTSIILPYEPFYFVYRDCFRVRVSDRNTSLRPVASSHYQDCISLLRLCGFPNDCKRTIFNSFIPHVSLHWLFLSVHTSLAAAHVILRAHARSAFSLLALLLALHNLLIKMNKITSWFK